MDQEKRWDGPAAMRTCETAAEFRKIAFELRNDSDPNTQAHWALPHHPNPSGAPGNADPGGVSAALGRLNQTDPTVMSKDSIRTHLERHQGSAESSRDGLELRVWDVSDWEIRHSGRKDEAFTVRGYPAVYDALSHNLGGFREKIAKQAFDEVLASDPDVHFVWDHDTRYVGARTRNGTLSLRSDEQGLFMDAQVGNYSWAKDLRTALERGDISQGSFAFSVGDGGDEWVVDEEDESITRTIRKVAELFDVTVTAQGAYPQTSLAVARSLAAVTGRSPDEVKAALVAEQEAAKGELESHKGSVEDDEDFARWKAMMETKNAARRATLAKLAGRLGRLE